MIFVETLSIFALTPVQFYLFLDRQLELAFHPVHQMVFAAGIQHPLLDATLVAGHRIDEDWKEMKENEWKSEGDRHRLDLTVCVPPCLDAGYTPITCGLQVVAFVGVFVEEKVVACGIFGDPHRQVSDLRWLSAAQPDHFLFGVDLLLNKVMKSDQSFDLHAVKTTNHKAMPNNAGEQLVIPVYLLMCDTP